MKISEFCKAEVNRKCTRKEPELKRKCEPECELYPVKNKRLVAFYYYRCMTVQNSDSLNRNYNSLCMFSQGFIILFLRITSSAAENDCT